MHSNTKSYSLLLWFSITIALAAILYAFAFVALQYSPFWLDEWFIIYNLKYKTSTQLWGQLDLLQQFPRLYLQIIKSIAALFNYSFFSLRMPFLLVHTSGIALCFISGKRFFKDDGIAFCIWLLIYVSNPVSIAYYFQVKQYTMEMLLALVAVCQLAYILAIINMQHINTRLHGIILFSLVLAPFFSYTYPIVAVPLLPVIVLQMLNGNTIQKAPRRNTLLMLTLLCASIAAAYVIDTHHVLQDKGMYNYWDAHFMHTVNPMQLTYHIYSSFANMGRGLFKPVMGIVSVLALLLGTARSYTIIIDKSRTQFDCFVLYSVLLIWFSVILFILKLVPLDEYRLNAYKVAAHAILLIYLFRYIHNHLKSIPFSLLTYSFLCMLAVFILQPIALEIIGERHKKRLFIYRNTEKAILTAQKNKFDIYTTRMPAYPHRTFDADFIIKSYPAFNPSIGTKVYNIDSFEAIRMAQASHLTKRLIVIGPDSFKVVK